jgi:uncharacterized protein (DUF885 family)
MRRIAGFLLLLFCCLWSAWAGTPGSDIEAKFARLSGEYVDGYLAWRPQQGTDLGLHEFDGRMTDMGQASLIAEHARLKRFAKDFAILDHDAISADARHQCRLLEVSIQNELFDFDDMKSYSTNPMTYASALDVNIYLKRNYAPLAQRLRSVIAIERAAPKHFANARANLVESLPKPYIELAIANGAADFLAKDLMQAAKDLNDLALIAQLKAANDRAIIELRGFSDWLAKERLPKAHIRYALGRERYQRMLWSGELVDLSPGKILEVGLQELKSEKAKFAAAAGAIDSTKAASAVFKMIQQDHPTEASLVPDVRKRVESIRQFVLDHGLVTIPSDVRALVKETPQFDRATNFASMRSPGPFETQATEAFYYITPVEPNWAPKQKEEWLTAFNYYTCDLISIHEAYPGHYVQFLNLNASKASRVEKIFGSYAFVEGWAHYTEQMMLDEGFGIDGDPVRAAKYRLAQSGDALLRLCRLCVSIKTHCDNMSVDDATKFFEENCFLEPKPARQEALRGTFDPGYLYYTLGKLQILKLRRDWQTQEGPAYSLRRFNDQMLSYGMPPIRLLREKMLKDSKIWDEIL